MGVLALAACSPVATDGGVVGSVPVAASDTAAPVPPDAWAGEVTRISDGDTLWVEVTSAPEGLRVGDDVKLRLLRIDTPEIDHGDGDGDGECWGDEATQLLAQLAPVGSRVWLAFDTEREDRFGRLLVHLWNPDGVWVNGALLAQGAAEALMIRPNDGYGDLPYELEDAAREAGLGLWGACPG